MKKKLLLVDDEKDIRDVLSVSLSDIGYDIFEAENGEEAMRLFHEVQPSIVLTDIKMPSMDGIELLQKVKQEDPDVEVIMITGHGDMDLAVKSLKFEAIDFISKPISVHALETSLQKAVDRIITRKKLREYIENLEEIISKKADREELATIGQYITLLSHGIKNILEGLQGGAYIVDEGLKDKDLNLFAQGWNIVSKNIFNVTDFVKNILYSSKSRTLKFEKISPQELLKDASALFKEKAAFLQIHFEQQLNPRMPDVQVDITGIRRALNNLIWNAMEACLQHKTKESHRVLVKADLFDDDHIVFEITDNGVGMDDNLQQKIFDEFFSTKGTGGTGLGLAVVKHVVQDHGGRIEVSSKPGEGSCFRIILPKG